MHNMWCSNKIIPHLFSDTISNCENVSVISIVGLGGLGKTMLARLVYNDSRVVTKFQRLLWVCVSNHFDNKTLVREILSQLGQTCERHESLEVMQNKLRNALRGQKFLLVLDDIWDEGSIGVNRQKWEELITLLNFGVVKESKVLVTTRSESVCSLVTSIHTLFLKGLSHQDSMSLFKKRAFNSDVDPLDHPQLMEIGEGIVRKCGGVPLAIDALGSLLHSKLDPRDWLRLRDDEIWLTENVVFPALKLSYDALPHHLKPCFAFCSLFPKDFFFHSFELIPLWMAQGYLKTSANHEDFEDIGLDYIRQIYSRSLFQLELDTNFEIKFRMHDLVHDLAIHVSLADYSTVNYRPDSSSSQVIRHVSLSSKELSDETGRTPTSVPSFMLPYKKLRTIQLPGWSARIIGSKHYIKTCISRFKYMRSLDLSDTAADEFPSSIGNLIHLRVLNCYGTGFHKFPSSLGKLLNLQYFNLGACDRIQKLPAEIWKLINLRYLFLTTQEECLPQGLGCLSLLRFLGVRNCNNLKSLGEGIQSLINLRVLWIYECAGLECLPPNMNQLTLLDSLAIIRSYKVDLINSGEGIRDLQSFRMDGLSSTVVPHWLENSAHTLQRLDIRDWRNLEALPYWLHRSKSLDRLVVRNCSTLSGLPEGVVHQLTALRHVEIRGCPALSQTFKRQLKGSKIARQAKIILDSCIGISLGSACCDDV